VGMLSMWSVRVLLAAAVLALAACHPGGEYATGNTMTNDLDRGETNGRMFDFVSNRADNDDWSIRVRGTSMSVAYGDADKTKKLGTQSLTAKESEKLWDLVDKVDIPSRGKGKKDQDAGYVELQLREPGDTQHEIYVTYVPRDNDKIDEDETALFEYLAKLVKKHFNTEPNF
jgi:hypothetical protein